MSRKTSAATRVVGATDWKSELRRDIDRDREDQMRKFSGVIGQAVQQSQKMPKGRTQVMFYPTIGMRHVLSEIARLREKTMQDVLREALSEYVDRIVGAEHGKGKGK